MILNQNMVNEAFIVWLTFLNNLNKPKKTLQLNGGWFSSIHTQCAQSDVALVIVGRSAFAGNFGTKDRR